MPGGPAGGNRAGGAAPGGGVTAEDVDAAVAAALAAAGAVAPLRAEVAGAATSSMTVSGLLGNTTHRSFRAVIDILLTGTFSAANDRPYLLINGVHYDFVQLYTDEGAGTVTANGGPNSGNISASQPTSRLFVVLEMAAKVMTGRPRLGRMQVNVEQQNSSVMRVMERLIKFTNTTDEIVSISVATRVAADATTPVNGLAVGSSITVYAGVPA